MKNYLIIIVWPKLSGQNYRMVKINSVMEKSSAHGQDRAPQRRINFLWLWGRLLTICSNVAEAAKWQIPVAVYQNQLRRMASETVDQFTCRFHPQFTGQYLLSAICTVQLCATTAGTQTRSLPHPRATALPLLEHWEL